MNQYESAESFPPINQGPLDIEPLQSKWPTVIGVLGIVFASMGLLCNCAGYAAVPLQRWGADMQAQAGQPNPLATAQVAVAEQFQIIMIILITIGLPVTVWLLMGSIALLRRRKSARTHLMGWAIVSMLLLAVNIAVQVLMFQSTAAELTRINEAQRIGELWISAVISSVFIVIFGLGLQIFVLIWFSRAKIQDEVLTWR